MRSLVAHIALCQCIGLPHGAPCRRSVDAGSILSYSAAILVPWDNDAVSPSDRKNHFEKRCTLKTFENRHYFIKYSLMMCSIFHSSMRWCPSMSCIMQWLAQLGPHKNPYLDGFFTRGRAASDAWWETHDQMASFSSMGIFGIRAPEWPKAKSLFDPLGPWAGPSSLDEPVDLAECAWSWRHKLDRCSRLLSLSACPILPLGCLFSATAAELEPRHGSHFDETCQPKNPVPDVGSISTSAPTRVGIWSHLWFKRFERFKLLVCKHP